MFGHHRFLIAASSALMIVGCATFQSDYETPIVNISSLRALPSDGIAPQFEIGLHIVNPNRTPLTLQGIAYTLELDGHKVLTGVANDLPTIDGYAEGHVTLTAMVSLLNGIRFFAGLMDDGRETVAYELKAKLDPGTFQPNIQIAEKGEIDLSGKARRDLGTQ